MMNKILNEEFFQRPARVVARGLLGKVIVRKSGRKTLRMIITETEAYLGENDLASHARFGRTNRNSVMYQRGGTWYIYLVYGMHWLLNVVTQKEESPSAVLIRGGILLNGGKRVIIGPGKITKVLKIGGGLNGHRASKKSALWIEDCKIKTRKIEKGSRIGVEYAGAWSKKPFRYYISASFVKNLIAHYN